MRESGARGVVERVVDPAGRGHPRGEQRQKRTGILQPVQPGHAVERLPGGQRVGLAVVDHLHAVLDRPQQRVAVDQRLRLVGADPARLRQSRERIAGRRRADAPIAPAVDQLVNLREELRLADAATAALQIIAGTERLPLRMVIANPRGDAAYLADRAEIERASPHERPDRIEKPLAERDITRRRAGADERRALPRQRLRLVIADRRLHRQDDRRDLGRGSQPQVDAQDIAVAITRLKQLDDALADPHRRLLGLLARLQRQGRGIEQEDRIDVRRIIEFAATLLAERDRGKAERLGAGCPLLDRGPDRSVERMVGEPGQRAGHHGKV